MGFTRGAIAELKYTFFFKYFKMFSSIIVCVRARWILKIFKLKQVPILYLEF